MVLPITVVSSRGRSERSGICDGLLGNIVLSIKYVLCITYNLEYDGRNRGHVTSRFFTASKIHQKNKISSKKYLIRDYTVGRGAPIRGS